MSRLILHGAYRVLPIPGLLLLLILGGTWLHTSPETTPSTEPTRAGRPDYGTSAATAVTAGATVLAVDERIAARVQGLRPAVRKRLAQAVKRLPPGVWLLVTSAWRSRAEQAAIRPTFGLKARPGTSTHEDGRAVDVNVLVDGVRISPHVHERIIGQAMASAGFRNLGPRDPVHYSVPKGEAENAPGDEEDELNVIAMDQLLLQSAQSPTAGTAAPTQ
jgi:hypothetical protein